MYRPSGYLIVELPKSCESRLPNCISYRGFDRAPWFFASSIWDSTLDDAFRIDLGLSVVDLETVSAIYQLEKVNIGSMSEVVGIRLEDEKVPLVHDKERTLKWIGYDALIKGLGISTLASAFCDSPENGLQHWSKKLNEFGLFDDLDSCKLFARDYEVESASDRVEPCNLEDVVFIEIGLLPIER